MKKKVFFGLLFGAIGLVLLSVVIILNPPGPNLVCHRMVDGAFDQWKIEERTNDGWFPNLNGSSRASLAVLQRYGFRENDLADYNYVPGLKDGDPSDLILLYTKEPSRRLWHGDLQWYRRDKKWVVPNLLKNDEKELPGDLGEGSRSISTVEFTNRLTKTLAYLAEQKRPYWATVMKEHSAFLDSLKPK